MREQPRKRLAVFLTNPDNPHQQRLKTGAERAAARLEAEALVQFAGQEGSGSAVTQTRQISQTLAEHHGRLIATIVHPVSGPGSERIVQSLTQAGVPCFIINRTVPGLEALRREFPDVPFCCLSPDQIEVGRIQGRQLMRLWDGPGLVLYVQGPLLVKAVQDRTAGMLEVVGTSKLQVTKISGDWLPDKAGAAVEEWFSKTAPRSQVPRVIGCQNDAMAVGARAALERVAAAKGEPWLKRIPVTGCDGAPDYGALYVRQGKLAATVELEDPIEAAFSVLDAYLSKREMPPLEIRLAARSLPDLTALMPMKQA